MDTYKIDGKKVYNVEKATTIFAKIYDTESNNLNIARKILFNFALAKSGELNTYQIKELYCKYRSEKDNVDELSVVMEGLVLSDLIKPMRDQFVDLKISPLGRAVLVESSHEVGLEELYKEIKHKKRVKNVRNLVARITQAV